MITPFLHHFDQLFLHFKLPLNLLFFLLYLIYEQ